MLAFTLLKALTLSAAFLVSASTTPFLEFLLIILQLMVNHHFNQVISIQWRISKPVVGIPIPLFNNNCKRII
jgi:hypothetical protein